MWPTILEKLERLKSLDKNQVIEEAKRHKYTFNVPATLAEIQETEARLGIAIPDELRMVYLEIGNGGAGPDSGLFSLNELEGLRANEPWPGIAEVAAEDFDLSNICGLVAVMDRYYNYKSCLVVSGPEAGAVIAYEEDAFAYVEGDSLASVYMHWLDKRLELFSELIGLFHSSSDIQEIATNNFLTKELHPDNTLLIAASLLGWSGYDLATAQRSIIWQQGKATPTFKIAESAATEFSNRIKKFVRNAET